MKKFFVFCLVVWGGWWYAGRHFDFSETLDFAHKHAGAPWAPAVEYSVGLVYYQRDDYPRTKEAFTQLLTDSPTGQYAPKALVRLSEVAEDHLDYSTAKDAVAQFLDQFPDDPDRPLMEKRKESLYNK